MSDQDIIDTIKDGMCTGDCWCEMRCFADDGAAERALAALRAAGYTLVKHKPTYAASFCPKGCDCSCCYGHSGGDCHCFTYPCNCGGGAKEHGK